jgi:anthranilate synthase/aminodeoxychorismate synthase-like glutamine amidotransferase
MDLDYLVISPGPGTPSRAGVSVERVEALGPEVPTLGVCLGQQAIVEAFGGRVVRAPELMHGKSSLVSHDNTGVFEGLPNPFRAIRYHSLCADPATMPANLAVNAHSDSGVIMGIRHRELPIEGVQFHPESILTDAGKQLLKNFLDHYADHKARRETPTQGRAAKP